MNRYFADVSNNNAQDVGWTSYRKDGQHVLVGLKASEGMGFIDKTHASRSEGAHKAGSWVLHYHFGHVGVSAREQVEVFWDQIKDHFARLDFACIDIEGGGMDRRGPIETARWVKEFDHFFRQYTGHTLIGYCNEALLKELVTRGASVAGDRWWIAAYGPNKPVVGGVHTWAWQFTDGVLGLQPRQVAGIGKCDVSILNRGTYTRLRLARPPR